MENNKPYLSVVVPLYYEEGNVEELVRRILESCRPMGRTFEVILVDDGSADRTPELLKEICEKEPECRALIFRRNFGQSAAMTAGFEHSLGEVVVSMDGDLQNDPSDIPAMLAKLEEGYDCVCGWRQKRKDDLVLRKIPSKVANRLIGRLTGVKLHDYGCSLKAYSGELIRSVILYGELHRFIPVLLNLEGAKIAEMVVKHHPRVAGESKYGIGRLPRVVLDLFLMTFFQRFRTRPLQFFGRGGGLCLLSGILIELYLTIVKFGLGQDIGTRPLLLLGALLILTGVMLLSIGLLAELVVRTYYETSEKRIYTVRHEYS